MLQVFESAKKTILVLCFRFFCECRQKWGVISHQLIQAMQPTLSNFHEIWFVCRTSFPDSKYTNFSKSAK